MIVHVGGVSDQSELSNERLEGVWVGDILLQAKSRHKDRTLACCANPGIEAVADLTADVDRERLHRQWSARIPACATYRRFPRGSGSPSLAGICVPRVGVRDGWQVSTQT